MQTFLRRHQPAVPASRWLLSGVGGLIAIALAGALSHYAGTPFLMAPFGVTCVLIFSAAASPFSQPANVVGGHLVSTLIGLVLRAALPNEWWAVALAVGLSIAAMSALRITHPPAGADPIVVFAADPGFDYLLFPVLSGSLCLVAVGALFHRATRTPYPLKAV